MPLLNQSTNFHIIREMTGKFGIYDIYISRDETSIIISGNMYQQANVSAKYFHSLENKLHYIYTFSSTLRYSYKIQYF